MGYFAHTQMGGGLGGNPILTPWELHPILIHFPIAFLLGGVVLSAYACIRGRLELDRVATGLLLTGVLTGLLAGAAGLLAFFTVPESHTESAHVLMYWHLGFMVGSLLLFLVASWVRWCHWDVLTRPGIRFLAWLAAVVFIVGAAFGGYIVYHGGTGIDQELMKPGLHEGHEHTHEHDEHAEQHQRNPEQEPAQHEHGDHAHGAH